MTLWIEKHRCAVCGSNQLADFNFPWRSYHKCLNCKAILMFTDEKPQKEVKPAVIMPDSDQSIQEK
jgi:hypothetical protein